jgi:hypothetical protein
VDKEGVVHAVKGYGGEEEDKDKYNRYAPEEQLKALSPEQRANFASTAGDVAVEASRPDEGGPTSSLGGLGTSLGENVTRHEAHAQAQEAVNTTRLGGILNPISRQVEDFGTGYRGGKQPEKRAANAVNAPISSSGSINFPKESTKFVPQQTEDRLWEENAKAAMGAAKTPAAEPVDTGGWKKPEDIQKWQATGLRNDSRYQELPWGEHDQWTNSGIPEIQKGIANREANRVARVQMANDVTQGGTGTVEGGKVLASAYAHVPVAEELAMEKYKSDQYRIGDETQAAARLAGVKAEAAAGISEKDTETRKKNQEKEDTVRVNSGLVRQKEFDSDIYDLSHDENGKVLPDTDKLKKLRADKKAHFEHLARFMSTEELRKYYDAEDKNK